MALKGRNQARQILTLPCSPLATSLSLLKFSTLLPHSETPFLALGAFFQSHKAGDPKEAGNLIDGYARGSEINT